MCVHDYSFFDQDEHSYYPGWRNQSNNNYSSTISNAFKYKSSEQLGTYVYVGNHETYEGGGYVYEFRGRLSSLQSNISQLHQLGWIDTRTRAVIIQLSLYNANVGLFTSVTFLIEILSTGGFYPTIRVEPMHFYSKYINTIQTSGNFLWFLFHFSVYVRMATHLHNCVFDCDYLFHGC